MIDQRGDPFLMVGDTVWSIFVSLTREEVVCYLDDRRQRGFNTLLTNLLEARFSPDPPRNRFGDEPFTTPGDFRKPNRAYFDHVRWVIDRAAERGLLVLLCPCWLGYGHSGWPGPVSWTEGWAAEVAKNGFDGCRAYGRFVGDRFGDLDNVVWVMGGDQDADGTLLEVCQMAEGIREADPRHLFTAHCEPESIPTDVYRGESWLDIRATYTYGIVHAKLYADYTRVPTMPFFLIESTYENEHSSSDVQLRRQAYWSVLQGGFGHVFGCTPVWPFSEGWEAALDLPGSRGMSRFAEAFRDRRWWDLVPEPPVGAPHFLGQDFRRLIVGGLGESRGLDYCSAARTVQGDLAMAYMPTPRRLTLDLSLLADARVHLSWFDPVHGGWIDGGDVSASANCQVHPPGDQDWLLVIEPVQGSSRDGRPAGASGWGNKEAHDG